MKNWPTGTVENRVAWAIREVRPAILADGGDIHLEGIDGSTVYLSLSGACKHCPMAGSTLSDFVLERILLYAPEIDKLVRVGSEKFSLSACGKPDTGP